MRILDFQRFCFLRPSFDGAVVRLPYRLAGGSRPDIDFVEQLTLPEAPADPNHPGLQQALMDLHVLCGVSYWKTCCPPEIDFVDRPTPDAEAAAWWTEIYTHGLGEFFYQNDLEPTVRFPASSASADRVEAPRPVTLDRVLMLIGGGKDSAVAREVLRHADVDVTLLSLGSAPWIRRSAAAMGDPHRVIGRKLDRQLFALNDEGAYNGHVPISAIIAGATRLVALIGGFEAVISANERSASYGNVAWRGMMVNHQWSKGLRFERRWQQHAARVRGGSGYFSLLRPLTELQIGACFARHERYFDHVTSCNANFRLRPQDEPARWCGRCPKCAFVFSILAPHLGDETLLRIFGDNFLAREENLPLLGELLGLEAHKPFECVGTPDEVAAALWALHRDGRMAETAGMRRFVDEVLPNLPDPAGMWAAEMTPSAEDAMHPRWRERLDAYLRAQ